MARGGYPSDKQDQFMIRFPDGMRDRVKASAERHKRSMNAEIISMIEMAFLIDAQVEGSDVAPQPKLSPGAQRVVEALTERVTSSEFHARLKEAAAKNKRSVDAEIIDRLENSFDEDRVNLTMDNVQKLISLTIDTTIRQLKNNQRPDLGKKGSRLLLDKDEDKKPD
ncbi:Arc family DNA-binding protein [Labrys sp. KB_33_2]|uniref:Arc family DNA-binding protein n=1 Tax=Labrys sp. KB_33_2 TaxID=3237479 RepID=UPI003F92D36D